MTRSGNDLKEKIIQTAVKLLSIQKKENGWSVSIGGSESDIKTTCRVIQSLWFFNQAVSKEIVSEEQKDEWKTFLESPEFLTDIKTAAMTFGCLGLMVSGKDDEYTKHLGGFLKNYIDLENIFSDYEILYFQMLGFYRFDLDDRYWLQFMRAVYDEMRETAVKGFQQKTYCWPPGLRAGKGDIPQTAFALLFISSTQGYRPVRMLK